ncbi:MAG: hypothetical protein R2716_08940 [Microthrixaceae bacterium]
MSPWPALSTSSGAPGASRSEPRGATRHARVGRRPPARRRGPTATANFGSSRREAHDSSAFYARFTAPELSTEDR